MNKENGKKNPRLIGVAGASGALGREIIRALQSAPYRPERIVPLARASTTTPSVEYEGEEVAIDNLEDEVLDRLDALFLALPLEQAKEWGAAALREGVPVIDVSGALHAATIPYGIPWVNPESLPAKPRALCVPTPEAILAASVLGPLMRAGLGGDAEATFFVPASRFGRDAIRELSGQVTALFNAGTPPRKIFEEGLAFDLNPSCGESAEGVTPSEKLVSEQVKELVDADLYVTRVTVPVFSGLSMELRIEPSRRPIKELVQQILTDGGLKVSTDESSRKVPRPRRVEGEHFASVGRIRIDERGEVLRIWASMDNLRASAVVAVGLGALLLR